MSGFADICADKGIKMTPQREIILNLIAGHDKIPEFDELLAKCRQIDPNIDDKAIYRALAFIDEVNWSSLLSGQNQAGIPNV